MHPNAYIYSYIWPYIPIYAPFWHPRGTQDLFIVHSQPGSWSALHQADTAMVQRHPASLQRAVAPTQLSGHADKQLNQVPYK